MALPSEAVPHVAVDGSHTPTPSEISTSFAFSELEATKEITTPNRATVNFK